MEQRTEQWFNDRLGKVTASRISDVMARLKNGGHGASRETYKRQLLAERLTGKPMDTFVSPAMQWGIDHEDDAREQYEFRTGHQVQQVGFIQHPNNNMSGASPDGICIVDHKPFAVLELKCPQQPAHLDFLRTGKIPLKYIQQVQWQMACTQTDLAYFASYHPDFPPKLGLWIERIERNDILIASIEEQVTKLLMEIDDEIAMLNEKYDD